MSFLLPSLGGRVRSGLTIAWLLAMNIFWNSALAAPLAILSSPSVDAAVRINLMRNAQREILVSTYLMANDATGNTFAALLRDAALRGLQVYLLIDDFAARKKPEPAVLRSLKSAGVRVGMFHRWNGGSLRDYFYRLHDKMLIVDAEQIVVGGRNMADEYLVESSRTWRDVDIVTQDAESVREAREYYLDLFSRYDVTPPNLSSVTAAEEQRATKMLEQRMRELLADTGIFKGWLGDEKPVFVDVASTKFVHDDTRAVGPVVGTTAEIINLIRQAKKEIYIETAYFVPTREMAEALSGAIRRGVKVTVLTNSAITSNQPLVATHYEADLNRLSKLVTNLYEYQGPNTLHSKYFVIDGEKAYVGSYNFNHRSQNLDIELGMIIDDVTVAEDLRDQIRDVSEVSELRIDQQKIIRPSNCGILRAAAIRLLRPML